MGVVKVTSKDLYNMKRRARNAQLGGLTAVQWLYDTLQELRWLLQKDLIVYVLLALMLIFSCMAGLGAVLHDFFSVSTYLS